MLMAVALSLLSSGPANAGYVSGTDLLGVCAPNKADPVYRLKVAECRGYVVGVADTFDCEEAAHGYHWNVKAEASQPQLAVTVISYLQSQPAALSVPAHINVAQALSQAYPCPKSAAAN